jgi:hypothetical protein
MDDRNSQRPRWYVARSGERQGPFTLAAIAALAENDAIEPDDLVWRPGFLAWIEAAQVPGLLIPPPLPEAIAAPAKTAAPAAAIGTAEAMPVAPAGQAQRGDGGEAPSPKAALSAAAPQPAAKGEAKRGAGVSAKAGPREPQAAAALPPSEGPDEEKLRALRAKLINTFERQQH